MTQMKVGKDVKTAIVNIYSIYSGRQIKVYVKRRDIKGQIDVMSEMKNTVDRINKIRYYRRQDQ